MRLSSTLAPRRPRADGALGASPSPSDEWLARAGQRGDHEAFGVLVERHGATARRVARSILGNAEDADDAAQDALLLAWRNLNRFDAHRPFRAWLMRIVVNAATDLYRRRRVRRMEAVPAAVADRGPTPDRATESSLLREHLVEALKTLSERHRIAVTMFDAEGYSHREIASVLEVPEGTVRSLVFHGRRALRRILEPFYGDVA